MNLDRPYHPSSLNRILDSSCALVMSTQLPKQIHADSEYYWNRQRLDNV